MVAVMATWQSVRAAGLVTLTSGLSVDLMAVTCTSFSILTPSSPQEELNVMAQICS